MAKKETQAEFYERNAKNGRTVRFDLKLDMNHVSDEDREKHSIRLGVERITGGTLTPEVTRKILDLIHGA